MMIDSLPPSILHAFENLQVLDFLLLPRLANVTLVSFAAPLVLCLKQFFHLDSMTSTERFTGRLAV